MRFTKTDVVVGMPATDAREPMRRFRSARPESAISVFVDTGERSDSEIARALHEAGYLEVKLHDLDGGTWWETTTKGSLVLVGGHYP
jgi:rhodanese-related sulfurtransferase